MVAVQEFVKRIPQEQQWLYNRDAGRVQVYVGRLAGKKTPDDATWEHHIRLAERLLIHAHSLPMNTQKGLGKLAADLRPIPLMMVRGSVYEPSATYSSPQQTPRLLEQLGEEARAAMRQ